MEKPRERDAKWNAGNLRPMESTKHLRPNTIHSKEFRSNNSGSPVNSIKFQQIEHGLCCVNLLLRSKLTVRIVKKAQFKWMLSKKWHDNVYLYLSAPSTSIRQFKASITRLHVNIRLHRKNWKKHFRSKKTPYPSNLHTHTSDRPDSNKKSYISTSNHCKSK